VGVGRGSEVLDTLVDAHERDLRKKLDRHGSGALIHTIRGVAYRLGSDEP
jgi:DNA-binding response OmpR family regulator